MRKGDSIYHAFSRYLMMRFDRTLNYNRFENPIYYRLSIIDYLYILFVSNLTFLNCYKIVTIGNLENSQIVIIRFF